MGTFTQDNRPVRASCVLGPNALLLLGFQGTEAISEPFEFVVDLLSEDPAVDGKKLLRSKFVLEVDLPNGSQRFISGHVRKFEQLGRHEQLTSYRAYIVPAMWYLKLEQDCRIFQHLSVLDIIDKVLKDSGITRVDVRCNATYAPREYCVQYRESDFDFISRLMEDEGICYFFEHSKDGDTLVLGDVPTAFTALPNTTKVNVRIASGPVMGEDVITSISNQQEVHTGKVTLRDYDFEQPSLKLEGNVKGKEPEEFYDYPGKFTKVDEGNRYARLMLEQRESLQEAIQGSSSVREFTPGYKFDLADHYRRDLNKSYVLLRVMHTCSGGNYQSWDQNSYTYSNDFVAFPSKTPFRPPCLTPRPIVHGTQSAIVVGPGGEEIHVDKHARVKVQFYWDRLGKKDDKSSCWVRVSSSWAGKGWGFIQIPRIGQEVLVDFLEGDPDQPIIVGRVYNAEQVPPFPLPGEQNKSGVQSRSTKGGAGANFNQISFDDTKGSELFYLHAEKDETHEVENDRSRNVGHDETVSVKNDQSISVGNNRTRDVGKDETVSIEKNQSISVGVDQTISVEKNRSKSVGKDESTDISANRTENVGKDENITIGANRTESVAKNEKVDIGEKREVSIGKDDLLSIGKKLGITVADEITIKTGDASITMKKDGTITIKGKDITLNGSGKINIKASGDVVVKGSKITQN